MQSAHTLKFCAPFIGLALLLATYESAAKQAYSPSYPSSGQLEARTKTSAERGELVGPSFDCDGDGQQDDARIDFDSDGQPDDCVIGQEIIPEPPFQQTETLSSERFYSLIPSIGWNTRYQCGDGLYEVTLRRPSENQVEYSAQGIVLRSPVMYDDIDPNLNHPLIVQDPTNGIRYTFSQEQNGEFYEYAIADYSGNVGLYIYQTGEQIVATPCTPIASQQNNHAAETVSQIK